MPYFFIFIGIVFVFPLYLNVRTGLDKLWLISILVTLVVLVIFGYWTISVLHQAVPERDNSMIWLYIFATFIIVQQLVYYLIVSRKDSLIDLLLMTKIEIDLQQYIDKNIADLKIGVLKELEKILLHYEVYSDGRYQERPYRPFEQSIGDERNQDIIKRIEVVAK